MILYHDLLLTVPLFVENYKFENTSDAPWELFNPRLISNELKDLFTDLGLEIRTVGLFTTIGWVSTTIHLDGHVVSDIAKLNWVQSSNDQHYMNWYTVNKNIDLIKLTKTDNDLPGRGYVNFTPNQVTFLESFKVKFPSLVNVGIPHNVRNVGGKRKCISITVCDKKGRPLPMNDAIDAFQNYL